MSWLVNTMPFLLPISTLVNRTVPKSSFIPAIPSKQKKIFTNHVEKILWRNKISMGTTNLPYREMKEFQVFEIILKNREHTGLITEIINRYIAYPLVCVFLFEEEIQISASVKHLHPVTGRHCVIGWDFCSEWFHREENRYSLPLSGAIDDVFAKLCFQLSETVLPPDTPLRDLIVWESKKKLLEIEINRLEQEMKKSKIFRKKIEWNGVLRKKREEWAQLHRPL